MASAEMQAGQAGHAFLADWLINRDIVRATRAFDTASDAPPRPSRPGWYSDSALNTYHECPTKFFLQRVAGGTGLERIYPPATDETLAKQGEKLAKCLAGAKDACEWLATDQNDSSDSQVTWATEMYLETPPPFRFRMWVDQLCWLVDRDALCVRDHKFTWKNDLRVGWRILYGDQLLLYAATFNRLNQLHKWGLPRCDFIAPNAVVVRNNGEHVVMPGEAKYLTPEREERFWARLHRVQEQADAFVAQASISGMAYAEQFMQPRSCWVYSPCPFVAACHEGVPLTDTRAFVPSSRASVPADEED